MYGRYRVILWIFVLLNVGGFASRAHAACPWTTAEVEAMNDENTDGDATEGYFAYFGGSECHTSTSTNGTVTSFVGSIDYVVLGTILEGSSGVSDIGLSANPGTENKSVDLTGPVTKSWASDGSDDNDVVDLDDGDYILTIVHSSGTFQHSFTVEPDADAANGQIVKEQDINAVAVSPEIDITSTGVTGSAVTDNAQHTLSGSPTAGTATNVVYTIKNSGTANLTLTQPTAATSTTNATVNSFALGATTVTAGNTTTLTVNYTPTAAGAFDFAVDVVNDDADENPFTISATATPQVAENNLVEETQKQISNFVQNRNNALLNVQPDITGFIDGSFAGGGGPLGKFGLVSNYSGFKTTFSTSLGRVWAEMERKEARAIASHGQQEQSVASTSVLSFAAEAPASSQYGLMQDKPSDKAAALAKLEEDLGTTALSPAQQRGYDVWVQVHGAKSEAGTSDSSLWVGYLGGHVFLNPNLLIGAMVQADWADENNSGTIKSSADGFGWMVGPYIAAKAPHLNLFFDARAAWGRSDNDLTMPTSTGSFETDRWLVNAKLSGLMQHGGWAIRPAVSVSYMEETQESFVDSLGNSISEQTFSLGEVRYGPTVSYDIIQDNGTTIRPKIGVNGVWNFDLNNNANSQGAVLGSEDNRARLDAGIAVIGADLWAVDLSGFYDGIGIDDYQAYGGKARLTVPLQ